MAVHGSNGHSDRASILAKSKVLKCGIQASMILMIEAPPPVEAAGHIDWNMLLSSKSALILLLVTVRPHPRFPRPGQLSPRFRPKKSMPRFLRSQPFTQCWMHGLSFPVVGLFGRLWSADLKKVARRVKQSSVQRASFCTSGQVLAAASTSYLMRNMIAVKELTWQLASKWRRYFGCEGISIYLRRHPHARGVTDKPSRFKVQTSTTPPLLPTKSKSAKRPSWISFDKHLWSQIKWSADQDNFVRSDQCLSRESPKKSKIRSKYQCTIVASTLHRETF